MGSKGKNAANLLKAFRNESLETLSKGFGKFSDDEAKLFAEVKSKLSGNDLNSFIKDMSDARHQNAVNHAKSLDAQNQAYLDKGYSQEYKDKDYIGRKAERRAIYEKQLEEKSAKKQAEKAENQAQYEKYNTIPEQNAAPRPNTTTYRNKGVTRKEPPLDWNAQVKDSHSGNAPRRSGVDIVPYVNPATQQEQIKQEAIKAGAKRILEQKELTDANKTGFDRFKDRFHDRVAGSRFNSNTTANRRDYNNYIHSQGRNDFVRSNKEFQRMQSKFGIHGTFDGTAEGFDALNQAYKESHKSFIQRASEKASEVASETNFMEYLGQGWDWATQDTQHALMVAGGAVGVGILGAEILDDDDDY